MASLSPNLILERCPHCSIASPNLARQHHLESYDHTGQKKMIWSIYKCSRCGFLVTAWANNHNQEVQAYFPSSKLIDEDIPEKPREYLRQAIESLHAPAGAVMLAASAVDSMLKLKEYSSGNLYSRIEKAVEDHVITEDMAKWAHEVRLDANDQRHADEQATLPTKDDAQRVIDFSLALAELLFVLPSRVQRGINPEIENG